MNATSMVPTTVAKVQRQRDLRGVGGEPLFPRLRIRGNRATAIRSSLGSGAKKRRPRPRKPSIGQSTAIRSAAGSRPLSCDMRIAFENAQFAAPEIKLGWIGGGAMTAFLTHAGGASTQPG